MFNEELESNILVEQYVKYEYEKSYLQSTDWVEPYLIKHYAGIELLSPDSNKFIIEQKRKEMRNLINSDS